MTYPASPRNAATNRVRPDSAQFWAGAVATAVVAALIALVGILICRWTLNIPILAPAGDGAWGNAHTAEYALVAALIAIIAAGLLYLLVLGTPQPNMFFDWITGLATLAAVVYPFSTSAALDQKAATAIVNLVLGIAIISLLSAVAARAIRRPVPPTYGDGSGYGPEQGYPPGQGYRPDRGYVPEPREDQPTQPVDEPYGRRSRRY
jgi:cytochrome b561